MARLSQEMVPWFKIGVADPEKEMEDRVENAAGFMGGEIGCGFNRDNNQPENGRDPGLQDFALVEIQDRERTSECSFCRKKRDKRAAMLFICLLFDGIVGGLAGNHNVVHVTLAQAGVTDAHEPRLLQQFRNGGAPTIAHARFQAAYHLIDDH